MKNLVEIELTECMYYTKKVVIELTNEQLNKFNSNNISTHELSDVLNVSIYGENGENFDYCESFHTINIIK